MLTANDNQNHSEKLEWAWLSDDELWYYYDLTEKKGILIFHTMLYCVVILIVQALNIMKNYV